MYIYIGQDKIDKLVLYIIRWYVYHNNQELCYTIMSSALADLGEITGKKRKRYLTAHRINLIPPQSNHGKTIL